MSDNTPIIESVPEDQQAQGAILDDDLHEQLWAEIDARIAKATSASYLQLARVVSTNGGQVQVQFFSATKPHGVGFAHTMGHQYRVDQRVVVAPLEGGDFAVVGAITSTQGPHERVVTNADLADDSVDGRVVADQSLTWQAIAAASIILDRLEGVIQQAVALALTSLQPGHVKGGVVNGTNARLLTEQTGIEPGDVKGGKPGNGDDKKIVTQDWVQGQGYYKEGNGQNAQVVTKGDLSGYAKNSDLNDFVKSSQLAKGATGGAELATKKWVQDNFKKKGAD